MRFVRQAAIAALLAMPLAAEEIREVDGTVYRKARVIQVDPDGIVVSHEKGVAKVDFSKLNPETRERFGYDARKAEVYREQQAAKAAASAEDKRRLLKEYEEREIARLQKLMENGASGDELVYGSRGAASTSARGARALGRNMDQAEADALARQLQPRTFWNSKFWDSPVVRALGFVLGGGGKTTPSAFGGSSSGISGRGNNTGTDQFTTPSYLDRESLKQPRPK